MAFLRRRILAEKGLPPLGLARVGYPPFSSVCILLFLFSSPAFDLGSTPSLSWCSGPSSEDVDTTIEDVAAEAAAEAEKIAAEESARDATEDAAKGPTEGSDKERAEEPGKGPAEGIGEALPRRQWSTISPPAPPPLAPAST